MPLPTKLIIACCCCFYLAGIAGADTISFDPSEAGIGARPLALGRAFTALADDASALFINPSGLASHEDLQLISMYSTLFNTETYLTLGASKPFKFGTLGIGYINVSSPNIEIYDFVGGVPTITGYTNYSSGVVFLSYSKKVFEKLQVGGNLKIYSQGFSGGGATYEALSGSGMDADLGLKFVPMRGVLFGLCAQNIVPVSMGGKFQWVSTTESESIPFLLKGGLAIKIFGKDGLRKTNMTRLTLIFDYDYSLVADPATHLGIEFQPVLPFTFRVGSDNGLPALGVGFSHEKILFDYAYRRIAGADANVSHAFSVGYSGDLLERKSEKDVAFPGQEKEKKIITIPVYTDVLPGYYAKGSIEKLAALGFISGYADGTFKPDKEITRAELAMFLVRSMGADTTAVKDRVFKDIPQDHWSAPYVKTAVSLGLITGYPDGKFRPNWPITRAEVAVVLSRFDNFPKTSLQSNPYVDVLSEHWAAGMIAEAKARGMLDFIPGEYFEPKQKVTRGEIVEMLYHTNIVRSEIKKEFGGET